MTDLSSTPALPCIRWGRTLYPYHGANLGTGNRCGHNPNQPEFHLFREPEWATGVPHVMRKLIEAVKGYYYAPLDTLPSLANLNGRRNKSGDPRKNRSEARVAECLIMRAVLYSTEYASLRVGTPKADGGFIPRSCTELAKQAGLLKAKRDPAEPDEPSRRFWRAFSRLRLAGAFDVYLQYDVIEDGSKRARPAIKRVNLNFLIALGACSFEQLKKFRTYCANSLKISRRAHREEFPTASDAAKAREELRRQQGESGVYTYVAGKRRYKILKLDSGPAAYLAASRDHHADLVRRFPDLSPPEIARLARDFPSLDAWLRDRQLE